MARWSNKRTRRRKTKRRTRKIITITKGHERRKTIENHKRTRRKNDEKRLSVNRKQTKADKERREGALHDILNENAVGETTICIRDRIANTRQRTSSIHRTPDQDKFTNRQRYQYNNRHSKVKLIHPTRTNKHKRHEK